MITTLISLSGWSYHLALHVHSVVPSLHSKGMQEIMTGQEKKSSIQRGVGLTI